MPKSARAHKATHEAKFYCKSSDGKTVYSTDNSFLYAERDGALHRLDLFDRHYYKLRLWNGVPILEVDGLRMQLVRDFKTPLDYAKEIVGTLHIPPHGKACILDTCMGLGYTAMEAAKRRGVEKVITCEISEAVITLAKWNPFGEGLFGEGSGNSRISVLHGSIADLIKTMPDSSYDFVIHDPPRFSHAPELYSLDFYKELHRVCKPDARVFHYVGSVGKKKGQRIEQGAMKKLGEAGFRILRYSARLQGIFAGR